jgi:surface antigen
MLKKSISILLALVMLIGVFSAFTLSAYSQEADIAEVGANVEMNPVGGSYGVNLSHTGYQSPPNPYGKPQCTWYCWGRAYEKLGISLPGWSHANTWDDSADANPNYSVGTEARANSIMVENSSGVGHVMFVEKVENGYAYITEGNYLDSDYHEDRINLSTMVRDSWTTHRLSPVRYIYLDGSEPIEPTVPNINVVINAPEVDISWNDVGAYGYYVYVENRDTHNIPYSSDLGRSFSVHLGLSEGHWRVYVMAMYSNNEIKSGSYDFDIVISSPSISVTVNAPTVDISWNDVSAYGYYVYVENRDTLNIPYSNDVGRSFSVHLGLSEGHWRVYVMALYSNNEIKSGSYDFDIIIPSTQPTDSSNIILGDTDGDGIVSIMDATAIQRRLASLSTESYTEKAADADGDGIITIIDATAIQRHLAHISTSYPIGEVIR